MAISPACCPATAISLAQADPPYPLSDALYGLAAAMDIYVHFGMPVTLETGDVRDALDQTMR